MRGIHADTNIVFQGFFRALCGPDEAARRDAYTKITEALKRLHAIDTSGLSPLVSDRIPAADVDGQLLHLLWDPTTGAAHVSCPGAGDGAMASDDRVNRSLQAILN